ncbi:MAG: bifunctional UDP-N-acetylmuramoyl-tripeptide:D-alanyl-D-alanine ligase/alanine racemase [Tannerella sp.]|jgi:alanine racemase|nr:bifunctional UDP-N-acetylmuramoyl-tripeptide:D-alanyl-D-alanine ligase/alanine racemase [Tannerella sp.]
MNYTIREIAEITGVNNACISNGNACITYLLTDSRTVSYPETSLFFALKTKSNDGHKYINNLYHLGVRNFVVTDKPHHSKQFKDANFLIVNNVLSALQKLASFHRKKFSIPVLGITGSNGKTVVKEFLFQLMRNDFNIVRSPRSYNSQIGVPLSVWEMNENHTFGIFEAGISKLGEMDNLRKIIRPTIGLITNIGEAHQENFKSAKEKCIEKLSLFIDSDIIIYNTDDKLIENSLEASFLSYKAIGWSRKDTDATLFVKSVKKSEKSTKICCVMMGVTHEFTVPFLSDAYIEDVIHCIAILFYLKPEAILSKDKDFAMLELVAMRLEIMQGINGCQIISDTYNSDINSLNVALDFQTNRNREHNLKNTIVLSDILQSGVYPETLYSKVSEILKRKKVERVIGIGKDISANSRLFSDFENEFFPSTADFVKMFDNKKFKDEIILIKGSRSFHFEAITELLEKKVHDTILEVNLDAVVYNCNMYRSMLDRKTKMICMVKAFGYGVGGFELAKTLQDHGCDYLAVAVADEGKELRKEGISIPLMVMNPELGCFNLLFEHLLEPEVYSFQLLDALIKESNRRGITSFPVHIKIDTGMHRLGFNIEEIPLLYSKIKEQTALRVRSVFTHLAGSNDPVLDNYTKHQLVTFRKISLQIEKEIGYPVLKHVLNSAGIERFIDYQMDMVRLGISLYGVSASGKVKNLQSVCSLKTIILQTRKLKAGDSVGYSRKCILNGNATIAVIPIGYADGYDRRLGNGVGEVLIKGKRCPVVGDVCMDTCMIDVTDVEAREGDEVIIFNDELTISEIASKINTIPYEILTSVSPRVKRIYYRE